MELWVSRLSFFPSSCPFVWFPARCSSHVAFPCLLVVDSIDVLADPRLLGGWGPSQGKERAVVVLPFFLCLTFPLSPGLKEYKERGRPCLFRSMALTEHSLNARLRARNHVHIVSQDQHYFLLFCNWGSWVLQGCMACRVVYVMAHLQDIRAQVPNHRASGILSPVTLATVQPWPSSLILITGLVGTAMDVHGSWSQKVQIPSSPSWPSQAHPHRVGKIQLKGQIWPIACFCKVLLE